MPFRSEKQRRFLWAKHPELAKRWAHDYPESNKNLPMYAKDTDKKPESDKPVSKAAALSSLRTALVNNCADVNKCSCLQTSGANSKTADSKLTHIKLPQEEKPTYAGERQIESILKPDTEDEGSIGQERDLNKQQNVTNPLLSKLAVVLAPKIQQEIEDEKAREQARVAQRVPNNVNVKQYPVNTPTIPPPMGMAQAPQAPQAPQQPAQPQQAQSQNGQLAAVGGGNSPNANPINSFGGLSSSGDINGNAAFGTANGLGTEKLAAQKCSCGCGQTVADCSCPVSCSCRKKGGSCYGKKTAAPKQASFDIAQLLQQLSHAHAEPAHAAPVYDDLDPEELTATLQPVKPQDPNMAAIAAILGTSGSLEYLSGKNRRRKPMKFAAAGDPIQGWLIGMDHVDPDTMVDILAEERMLKAAVEKWAEPDVNAPPAVEKPKKKQPSLLATGLTGAAGGLGGFLLSKYLASKGFSLSNLLPAQTHEEKAAGTPAWQRSAGKNEEGGLNEKGRKSYEREHGGNLKAPVTESNPSGERAKRQNSFCSRMCGMKRVNTGASTAKDPDSRINKSLRKWNCKCGSALEFASKLAYDLGNRRQSTNVVDMTKNLQQPGPMGRMLGEKPSTNVLPRNFNEAGQFLDYAKKVQNDTMDYRFDGILRPQKNEHTQAVDNFHQRMQNTPQSTPTMAERARSFATNYIPGAGRAIEKFAPRQLPPTPANHPVATAVQDAVKKYQSPLPGKK